MLLCNLICIFKYKGRKIINNYIDFYNEIIIYIVQVCIISGIKKEPHIINYTITKFSIDRFLIKIFQ